MLKKVNLHSDPLTKSLISSEDDGQLGDQLSQPKSKQSLSGTITVREGIHEELPQKLSVTQLAKQLQDASYTVEGKKAERTEHSESMSRILNSVEALGLFLDFPVVMDKEGFATQLAAMEDRYRHLTADCTSYLETHHPWSKEGKVRRDKVEEILKQASEELLHLRSSAESFQAEDHEGAEITWRDVMAGTRTQKFVHDGDKTRISHAGGNTSLVHVIEQDEKKTFFKKRENIPPGSFDNSYQVFQTSQSELVERIQADPSQFDHPEELLERTQTRMKVAESLQIFIKDTVEKLSQDNPKRNAYDLLDRLYTEGSKGMPQLLKDYPGLEKTEFFKELKRVMPDNVATQEAIRTNMEAIKQYRKEHPDDFETLEQLEKDLLKMDEERKEQLLSTTIDVVHELHKTMFAARVAKDGPMIDKERELSTRNVATSRLAEYLELGDTVVSSSMAQVEINGEKMDGVAMEQAHGRIMGQILLEQVDRQGQYSVKSAKQLFALQILDVICGQTDRHVGNYMAQMTIDGGTYTIDGITAIDSDMAFGLLPYDKIISDEEKHRGSLVGIEDSDGNFTLPAMSEDLANRILSLEPGMLRYMLGDILNVQELAALTSRLEGVQNAIARKRAQEEKARKKAEKAGKQPPASIFFTTDEEWARMLEDAKQHPDKYANVTYLQKNVLVKPSDD